MDQMQKKIHTDTDTDTDTHTHTDTDTDTDTHTHTHLFDEQTQQHAPVYHRKQRLRGGCDTILRGGLLLDLTCVCSPGGGLCHWC